MLCSDANPERLIVGMAKLRPFQHIYVADLNAIMGKGAQTQIIRSLTRRADIWLDQGIGTAQAALSVEGATAVVGSESLADVDRWGEIRSALADDRLVLSLDFDPSGAFIGPDALWRDSSLWPSRVIVMTLARVGAAGGPDFDLLGQARARSSRARIYAAGGVRDNEDIEALAGAGCSGALVATALHDGTIK